MARLDHQDHQEHEDHQDNVRRLLHELCVDLGFCLPPEERRRLREAPPADAGDFTDAVFAAEGMVPAEHPELRRQVRAVVERHQSAWQRTTGRRPGGPGAN